jgi:hypothetical protein
MSNPHFLHRAQRAAWLAAKVTYWSFAACMILTGASVVLGLVACFVFPFLPLLVFFPLMSALGSAGASPMVQASRAAGAEAPRLRASARGVAVAAPAR